MKTFFGADCTACSDYGKCGGCIGTEGRPFGAECAAARCARQGEGALDACRSKLIAALNALDIPDMEPVTSLNMLKGAYINLEYTLPGGQRVKFWNDEQIYFASQQHKTGSDRCYGVAADETWMLVSEYGCGGSDTEIVVFRRWRRE